MLFFFKNQPEKQSIQNTFHQIRTVNRMDLKSCFGKLSTSTSVNSYF